MARVKYEMLNYNRRLGLVLYKPNAEFDIFFVYL